MTKTTILDRLAKVREELTRIEDELYEEIDRGLFAIVKVKGASGNIPVGSLVRITEFDGGEVYYLTAEHNGEYDYYNAADLEAVTSREQAKSALMTEVERQLDELFGPAEGSDE